MKLAVLTAFSAFTVLLADSGAKTASATSLAPLNCKETFLPVALVAGEEAKYQIYGELCARGAFEDKTVRVYQETK